MFHNDRLRIYSLAQARPGAICRTRVYVSVGLRLRVQIGHSHEKNSRLRLTHTNIWVNLKAGRPESEIYFFLPRRSNLLVRTKHGRASGYPCF
ncbi:hypothetical protein AMST5_03895 [freshwater sediment metagenome]|uniref:Uncharacterized protein n=1 Tax=freshwater sediment metagenome TaxID=556182 RepID=A0AA48RF04_9ZZZZ